MSGPDTEPRSKVAHRLGLARTHLRKLGYVDHSSGGIWALEPASRSILDLDVVYINGGRRGHLVGIDPKVLVEVLGATPVRCAL